jgi:hypothetical protein
MGGSEFTIPGWRMLGPGETPMPGDVVAQQIEYEHATGHVMIIGPGGTAIGIGESELVEHEPEPPNLAKDPNRKHGSKVYRRWGN